MATVKVRGEGGAVFELDDQVEYVAAQLASGALVPIHDHADVTSDVEDKPVQKRRGRPPKAEVAASDTE